MNRRDFTTRFSLLLASALLHPWRAFGQVPSLATSDASGNFAYIYSNPPLRASFLNFLTNVFHLYPEQELHQLIAELTRQHRADRAVYEELQQRMAKIKPFLAELRYAVPALAKQKEIMTDQTLQLLGNRKQIDGCLEVGSTGRYVGRLEDKVKIRGEIFLLHTEKPGFGPEDIVERGQLTRIGTFVDMGNYDTTFARVIPRNSLDLVTVYIGFHHCPVEKRLEFISALRDVLKPKGQLILRDHNANNADMFRMAALAHDVFNAGIHQPWAVNQSELRNFYSNKFIIAYLDRLGLQHKGQILFQEGDPTQNGLMAFTKV
jgi:SAM-dependent methyltransferase